MLVIPESAMTRRRFLASMTLMAGVVCFAQRDLFAAPESLVEKTRASAAKQKITVQKLRGNVSVLMGVGSPMHSQPSADPIKRLINTHWHFDHRDGNDCTMPGQLLLRMKILVSTFPPILGLSIYRPRWNAAPLRSGAKHGSSKRGTCGSAIHHQLDRVNV